MKNKIKELRIEKKLSQQDLAKILETTQDTISLWELNKRQPNAEMLIRIADYFECSIDYLVGRTDY